MKRSDLLRRIEICTLAQAFLSIFVAIAASATAGAIFLLHVWASNAVKGHGAYTLGGLLGTAIMIIPTAVIVASVPIWVAGNLMTCLSVQVVYFRKTRIWLTAGGLISVLVFSLRAFQNVDWYGLFFLFSYGGLCAFIFRLLLLRAALGIWSDLSKARLSDVNG